MHWYAFNGTSFEVKNQFVFLNDSGEFDSTGYTVVHSFSDEVLLNGFEMYPESNSDRILFHNYGCGSMWFSTYDAFSVSSETYTSIIKNTDNITITTGQCGDNAYWSFDKSTGTLTINGTGNMYDYATIVSEVPWKAHRKNIKRVVVEEGITGFYFDYNLNNYPEMDSYVLPKSVNNISGVDNTIYRPTKDVTIYGYTGTESKEYSEEYEMTFYSLNGEIYSYISCPDTMLVNKTEFGGYDTNIITFSLTIKNDGKYDLKDVFINLNLPDGVRCDDINAGYEEWNGTNVPKSLPDSFVISDDNNQQMKLSLNRGEEQTLYFVLYVNDEILERNQTNYSHMVQENIVTFSAEVGAYDENNTHADTQDIVSVISTPTETISKSFNIVHDGLINNELSSNDILNFNNYYTPYFNVKKDENGDIIYEKNNPQKPVFEDYEKDEHQISDKKLNLLIKDMDNVVKDYVKKIQTSNWNGSCEGMSRVVSL